jgi:hypothetical protein
LKLTVCKQEAIDTPPKSLALSTSHRGHCTFHRHAVEAKLDAHPLVNRLELKPPSSPAPFCFHEDTPTRTLLRPPRGILTSYLVHASSPHNPQARCGPWRVASRLSPLTDKIHPFSIRSTALFIVPNARDSSYAPPPKIGTAAGENVSSFLW